jgi:isopenicillin N synthase-like dioxygenase
VVLEYMARMTFLAQRVMMALALSLGQPPSYFLQRLTAEPTTLFRIFNYPDPATFDDARAPDEKRDLPLWGVGEHTDYGLLTILKQDDCGGLQVKTPAGWAPAPPLPNTFVCNIGDMLDRLTRGLYRSTPHRVANAAGRDRLSFPFFFDPSWDATLEPIGGLEAHPCFDERRQRWDESDIHAYSGTYGSYLAAKVAKVFPKLFQTVVAPVDAASAS